MKKLITKTFSFLWGKEIWIHSPLLGKQTSDEDGNLTTLGPLVKIIQANKPLSVQVHPDDKLALQLEDEPNGKSEAWYILESKNDSNLVLGLSTYDQEVIRDNINNESFEELLVQKHPQPREFYNVPAGLVHGIGQGITLLEIQQPSNITYRYYDYNRVDKDGNKRELHLEKALISQKDITYKLKPINESPLTYNLGYAQVFIHKSQSIINQESIIINLDNFEAYIGFDQESVSFTNYVVIPISQNN